MKLKKVYIAGKLNDMACDYIKNMSKMMIYGQLVKSMGFAIYVPCLDFIMGLIGGDWDYDDYYNNNQAFLEDCDAVFVCPGYENSKGTMREISFAKELEIPVFFTLDKLKYISHDQETT